MLLTFTILLITIALFMSGRFRADGVAVMSMLALLLCGLVNPGQALAGFSSGPVVMIATLFVVGGGLTSTGITHWLGQRMIALAGSSETRLVLLVIAATGALSAFMSNTGVVAMLLPAVLAAVMGIGSQPKRVLLSMAYAANLGGLLTMIGTPPNLIVNGELSRQGLEPFGFFTFALIGLPLLAIVALYMTFIGRSLLHRGTGAAEPERRGGRLAGLITNYGLSEKFFELVVGAGSDLIGKNSEESQLLQDCGAVLLQHRRADDTSPPEEDVFESWDLAFKPGDRLLIKVDPGAVEGLAQRHGCSYQALSVDDVLKQRVLFSKKIGLVEVLLPPRSSLIGREALPGRLNRDMRIQVLAMQRHGSLMKHSETTSGATILREGDVALARASWSAIRGFADRPQELILIGDPKRLARENMELDRSSYTSLAILAGMVLLMLTGAVPAVTATLLAAAAMVLSGCLSMEDSYREINWQSVILIASMFPMATAIQESGGAAWLANGVTALTAGLPPVFLLAGVFTLTCLLSQVISNTAATILVVPIVVATANTMGVSPYPLLMGTAAAASTALMTPIGTVPNLLVMVPGGYDFKDYIKCGLPLTLLLFAATLVLVPMIWPFYP